MALVISHDIFISPGSIPFFEQKIQELFKDFQRPISHVSETPFSAKKSLESTSFVVLDNMSNFIPKVFLCLLLLFGVLLKL